MSAAHLDELVLIQAREAWALAHTCIDGEQSVCVSGPGWGVGHVHELLPTSSNIVIVVRCGRKWRASVLGVKGSVETHQRRLQERQDVMASLTSWVNDVLVKRWVAATCIFVQAQQGTEE